MNLEQLVETRIKEMYEGGKTQVEIAELCNVTQSYIQRLLSGKQGAGGITIRVFCRMFPNATVSLNSGHQSITGSNVAVGNKGTVNQSINEDKITNKLSNIQSEIMAMGDLSAEHKVLLYQLLEKHK